MTGTVTDATITITRPPGSSTKELISIEGVVLTLVERKTLLPFEGYLLDTMCYNSAYEKMMGGKNDTEIAFPEKHTADCLLEEPCMKGYGVLFPRGSADGLGHSFVQIADGDTAAVVRMINDAVKQGKKKDDFAVTVESASAPGGSSIKSMTDATIEIKGLDDISIEGVTLKLVRGGGASEKKGKSAGTAVAVVVVILILGVGGVAFFLKTRSGGGGGGGAHAQHPSSFANPLSVNEAEA